MGFVNVDDLEAGMVLETDLHTQDGRYLLPAGKVLDEKSIMTCKAWGISRAGVLNHDQDSLNAARMAAIDPQILASSKKILKPYFSKSTVNHPAMVELIRIAVEHHAARLARGNVSLEGQIKACVHLKEPDLKDIKPLEISALQLVREQVELISLPDIFYRILEVLESPFSSAKHVADVVSKDSSLSAKLLRLVNSAFYGFPSKIDSISRAVAILGSRELTSLALGISVLRVFQGIPREVLNMENFWKHSVSCGVYSSLISLKSLGFSDERFFVAGMLHDIGRLILIKAVPDHCLQAMGYAVSRKIPLYQAEQKVLGFDHARIGGLLCREWKMPVALEKMVRCHHEPSKAINIAEAATVYLANIMSLVKEPDTVLEGKFPPLCVKAWDSLGIDRSDLCPIVQEAERSMAEIMDIFLSAE